MILKAKDALKSYDELLPVETGSAGRDPNCSRSDAFGNSKSESNNFENVIL